MVTAAMIPTKANLEQHPQAIVLSQYLVAASTTTVAQLEFEWFDTDLGRIGYFDEVFKWCADDLKAHGDVLYVISEVIDTASMKLGRVLAIGSSEEWNQAAAKAVKASPLGTLVASATPVKASVRKVAPKAKVSRGRAPSAAASAVQGPVAAGNAPTPKAKVVRKKVVAPKTGDEQTAPAAKASGAETRSKALKERLAERQAQEAASEAVQPSMALARFRKTRRN